MHQPLLTIDLHDADATHRLGQAMASRVGAGDVLLLEGPIGAGKTHFARALIQTLLARHGTVEDIPSPTFTLVQTYHADVEIWHADLYRLGHPDEAIELGLQDAFDTALCLIEWPERLGDLAPADALHLRFDYCAGGASRRVVLAGTASWAARLADIAEQIGA